MKKIINCFILASSLFFAEVLSYNGNNIYTLVDENTAPCYKKCQFLGLYFDINLGLSWLTMTLHRPELFGLFPLNNDFVRVSKESFMAAVGYDFYPCLKFPARFEVSCFYVDEGFTFNPLFIPPFGEGLFVNDGFIVRNTMATLYFDWHTCTRFVPYVGVSGGLGNVKTSHNVLSTSEFPSSHSNFTDTHFAWGANIGTRYFFTNYLFANIQLRYSNLGRVAFKNFASTEELPNQVEFFSDYLHEATIMLGLGYVF